MKISTPTIVVSAAATAILVGALGFVTGGGWTTEGALAATRLTARAALPIFLLAWSASAVATLFPGGWRTVLLRRRRAVGLSFAVMHFVHLGFILTAVNLFGHQAARITVIFGGLTYAMIALMALTSNDAAIRMLGSKGWRALHVTGGLMVLLVFTNSYVGRLMTKPMLAVPALALIGLAVGVKLAAWIVRGRRVQAA